jgi:hypothetical protein
MGSSGNRVARCLQADYEVYAVSDVVVGTSVEAHQVGFASHQTAGDKMTSVMQFICELQRDWARKDTVGAFVKVASEIPGTFAI